MYIRISVLCKALSRSYITKLYQFFICRVDESLNIKVADFGLARDVYMADYYRQQSIGKIPVKWMAPEALNDKISSEKTDVVSLMLHPSNRPLASSRFPTAVHAATTIHRWWVFW